MLKELKNLLWWFIITGISLLLLPTLATILVKNADERDNILSFLENSGPVFQIIGLIVTTFSGFVFTIIFLKERKARQVLVKASANDAIWDMESLKYQTRAIFYKIQAALGNGDLSSLKGYVTPEFMEWFKQIIENKKQYFISKIDVTDTHIICCDDFQNNNKDKFVGYIKGNIETETEVKESSPNEFSEVYHFIRSQNDWLLDKISGSNIFSLIFLWSEYEK